MKLGAYDYVLKPVDAPRLRNILANASRQRETDIELEVARRRLRESGVLGSMVGTSKAMREIFALIEQIAPSNVSVLITGESGTGKELVARTLHDLSPRKPRPFVAVNCAAIPETLIESEIFGHEKGSFTGAVERRVGLLRAGRRRHPAAGRTGRDAGGHAGQACCASLKSASSAGWARATKSTWTCACSPPPIAIPTTPSRGPSALRPFLPAECLPHSHAAAAYTSEDLPAMAEAMLNEMNQKHGRKVSGVAPSMLDRMMAYHWPGNARELRNTIERAVILCPDGAPLDAGHLPPGFGKAQPLAPASTTPVRCRCA